MIIDVIFPHVCGVCGKICKEGLCKKCLLKLNNILKMDYNMEKIAHGNQFFEEHFYIANYSGDIKKMLINYKFNDKSYLARTFLYIIRNNEKICEFLKKYDIITPVPIHKARRKERGYDQNEIILRGFKEFSTIKVDLNIIVKIKGIKPQSTLNKKDRIKNIKNVYRIRRDKNIHGKSIILLDDIYTTGSTVNECSRMLKLAGAKNVGILTISKD